MLTLTNAQAHNFTNAKFRIQCKLPIVTFHVKPVTSSPRRGDIPDRYQRSLWDLLCARDERVQAMSLRVPVAPQMGPWSNQTFCSNTKKKQKKRKKTKNKKKSYLPLSIICRSRLLSPILAAWMTLGKTAISCLTSAGNVPDNFTLSKLTHFH